MDFGRHCGPERRDSNGVKVAGWGAEWRGILFRQTYPQLADVVAKTRKWFPRIFPDATFSEQKMTWKWSTGEELLLRHMQKEDDYWNYHGHCVDEGDVLIREKGWLPIQQVVVGQEVLSWDKEKNEACWERVDHAVHEQYEGELVRYKGRGRYMSFTPNHRLVEANGERTPYVELERNAELLNGGWGWAGQEIGEVSVPEISRTHGGGTPDPNPLKISGDHYCEFMGWFLSEGWVLHSDNNTNLIGVSQTKIQHRLKIQSLLSSMRIKFRSDPNGFCWQSKSWNKWLKKFGKCRDKYIPEKIKNATTEQLKLFFDAFVDGDGSRQSGRCYIYTSSVQLRDGLTEIATKLGYAVYATEKQKPNRRGLAYTIACNPKKTLQLKTDNRQRDIKQPSSQVQRVPFSGEVYCLGVRKTHTFFVRQRGSVWLSSNSYPWIGWEELTTWPNDKCYKVMMACSRSTMPGMPRKYRATTNPYGIGHNFVKSRFQIRSRKWPDIIGTIIDYDSKDYPEGMEIPQRVAIHGYLCENKVLLHADPGYEARLREAARNPSELAAWLEGSWDIVAGGMFDDVWSPQHHIVSNFDVPHSWEIQRSFDWGSSKPFSVGWWARSDGTDYMARGKRYSTVPGDLFRVAEWYGWNGQPNEGLRMVSRDIAKEILHREGRLFSGRRINPGPADGSIYDKIENSSIGDEMMAVGVYWTRADKSPGSRKQGWEKMRSMLKQSTEDHREEAGMFVCEGCHQFIRTVPVLPRSERDPDDVDTDAEDHTGDESRYMALTRSQRLGVTPIEGR